MKIGAIFPTTEIGNDPIAIRDWVQTAEALGYHHVLIYDHVLGAEHANRDPKLLGPYTENDPFHEVFVLLAWLAGITTKIELTTGILILPQRQTALVAKQAVELDLLSGGRFRMGVGTGWNHVEYTSLGAHFDDRGARFTEQIELMRALWREPVIDFDGEFHRVERAGLLPQPTRPIPIWFGGFSEVAMRRAARLGDGFIYGTSPSRMQGMLSRIQALLVEEGRTAADFGGDAVIEFSDDRNNWSREIELWGEKGGTHVSLRAMDTGAEMTGAKRMNYDGPQAYIDALETFMKTVS